MSTAQLTSASSPFDAMAEAYDSAFTHSLIGTRMRCAVWQRLDTRFKPGDHILELNCGTGEDALYLAQRGLHILATDVSQTMLEVAQAKASQANLTHRIEVRQLAIEALDSPLSLRKSAKRIWAAPKVPPYLAGGEAVPPFDGILSNFGGLNCVADLNATAARLSECIRTSGFAMLCVMGPACPWEWAWYLRKGQSKKAFRRLTPGGTRWRGLTIRYPSITRMRRAFVPYFRCIRVSAVGALLPPTYAETWAARHPHLLARLDAWERRWETYFPLPSLADHYLLELQRK